MLDPTNLSPIAFTLPFGENGFPIYWYGILVVVGIAIGTWWASREVEKRDPASNRGRHASCAMRSASAC